MRGRRGPIIGAASVLVDARNLAAVRYTACSASVPATIAAVTLVGRVSTPRPTVHREIVAARTKMPAPVAASRPTVDNGRGVDSSRRRGTSTSVVATAATRSSRSIPSRTSSEPDSPDRGHRGQRRLVLEFDHLFGHPDREAEEVSRPVVERRTRPVVLDQQQ